MRLITYNLRRGGKDRVHWKRLLKRYDPDVLLVQESYPPAEHLADDQDRSRAVWAPATGKNGERKWGSGIYLPGHTPRVIEIPRFHGWVVGAEVDGLGPRKARIFSLHAPSHMGTYRRVVNDILDLLRDFQQDCDLVIGGDFNLGISLRHAAEKRQTASGDRKIQERLRDEFELVNCWQAANPNKPLAQTLRWSNQPEVPYHCDALFIPATWARQLRSSRVISGRRWDSLSDHNPVMADIDR